MSDKNPFPPLTLIIIDTVQYIQIINKLTKTYFGQIGFLIELPRINFLMNMQIPALMVHMNILHA